MLLQHARSAIALIFLPAAAVFATGCADAYIPKPSPRVAVVPDGGLRLMKDGRGSSIGVTGSGLQDAVRGNPRAEAEADAYSTKSTAAFVCSMFGIGTALAGGIMFVDDAAQHGNDNKFPTTLGWGGLGLLIGSAALSIVSGSLHDSAQTNFWNAINIYNDGIEPRPFIPYPAPYGAPVPAPGYRPLPSFQGPPPGYGPPPSPPPGVPPGLVPSPPPGAPGSPAPGGALGPVPSLPPGALPPAGSQPQPLLH